MRPVLRLLLLSALAVPAAASAAITISNVSVVGTTIVNQNYLGNNGYTFVFDSATSKATGNGATKQILLNYTVTSTAPLVGYQFSPLGTAFRGGVNVSLKHNAQTDLYSWSSPITAGATSSLAQRPAKALSGLYSYNVASVIDLSTLSATPRNRIGIGALTQFNVAYTPVPEPASLAVLGMGGLALLRRRSRKA